MLLEESLRVSQDLSKPLQGPKMAGQDRTQRLIKCLCDLFETHFRDVSQVQDLLIGFSKLPDSTPQGLPEVALLLFSSFRSVPSGNAAKDLMGDGNRMPAPPSHLIPEPIHGDAKKPRLEFAQFLVAIELRHHRAESRLSNLLGQFCIAATGEKEGIDPRSIGLDDLSPGLFVPFPNSMEYCLEPGLVLFESHAYGPFPGQTWNTGFTPILMWEAETVYDIANTRV